MNLILMPGKQLAPPLASTRQDKRLREWLHLLENCAEKPSRRRVHGVRVATLRLFSAAEAALASLPAQCNEAAAVRRWMKQARKIRKVLSPIRAVDVYRSRLANLRTTLEERNDAHLHIKPELLEQVDRLDIHLKRQRKKTERRLSERIRARLENVREIADSLETVFLEMMAESGSISASSEIAALMSEFPEFSEENLHSFRKRLRQVRYRAEASAVTDPNVKRAIGMLRSLQVEIGTWHDWDALTGEARKALRGIAKGNDLAALLGELAGESLTRAIEACARTMEKLGQLALTKNKDGITGMRRPVQRTAASRGRGLRRA